jgi:methyl-accepting chemotaxis protein
VVIGILNLAAIEALYWLDAYPVDGNTVTLLAIQNLAVSSLMVAISTVASAALVRMTGSLIAEVQKRADESASSYGNLSTAMNEAQASSQQIGEMLSASVIRTVHAVESLRERAVEISGGMDDLRLALSQSSEENKTAVQKQGKVKEALTAYSDEVARASSAIEEMAAAAGSISLQASQKSEAVRGLVSLSTAGENLLASMNHSINQILDSAKRMMETSVFIGDVAERTNLLGMNASIEAAHAGAAGKGFAVVADQIRGLSVEASKSSRLISDTLKETQASVEAAAGKNGEALSFFKKISEEIRGVSLMIEELLASIKELSAGSADVLKAVEAVADLTRKTDAVVDASCESISRSSEGIESVVKLASRVREEAAEMAGNFDQMKKDAEEVKLLGGENLSTIQSLKKSLDGFAPAGGGLKGLASQ